MKNSNCILSIAAAALLISMAACSNDDNLTESTGNGATPIVLKTSISNASTRSVSQTLQETAFEENAKVGVIATVSETSDTNWSDLDNAEATVESGYINLGSDVSYPTDGADVSIVAYAPHTDGASLESELTFTVKTDQSDDADYIASDLLYAPAVSANSNSAVVDLTFSHKLAKINVTFDGDEAENYAPGKTVTIKEVETEAKIDLTSGDITNVTGNAEDVVAAQYDASATTFTASAIVAPQTVSTLTVTIGDQTYTLCGTSLELKSGYRYNLTATIESAEENATGNLVLQSTIDEWEDYSPDNYVFDLTADAIDPDLLNETNTEGASWDASTGTLITATYGQGGWNFSTSPIDLSAYSYLVLELGAASNITGGVDLRLLDDDNLYGDSYVGFTISDNDDLVVIDLTNLTRYNSTDNTSAFDLTSIHYVVFWTYGGTDNEIVIKKMYATNYPPAEANGTTSDQKPEDD